MSFLLRYFRGRYLQMCIEVAADEEEADLDLSESYISELPDVRLWPFVERIFLQKNSLMTFPAQITQLPALTALLIDYNKLSSLPPEISHLKNLITLNISYNPLKTLLPEIGSLESLEEFWCNSIDIQELPPEIGNLLNLKTLGARNNHIRSLPDKLCNLINLEWLTLENNHVERLPDEVGRLVSLVHLNMAGNWLTTLPSDLVSLQQLRYMQFSNNYIVAVPDDFLVTNMQSLEVLDLGGNPIENDDCFLISRNTERSNKNSKNENPVSGSSRTYVHGTNLTDNLSPDASRNESVASDCSNFEAIEADSSRNVVSEHETLINNTDLDTFRHEVNEHVTYKNERAGSKNNPNEISVPNTSTVRITKLDTSTNKVTELNTSENNVTGFNISTELDTIGEIIFVNSISEPKTSRNNFTASETYTNKVTESNSSLNDITNTFGTKLVEPDSFMQEFTKPVTRNEQAEHEFTSKDGVEKSAGEVGSEGDGNIRLMESGSKSNDGVEETSPGEAGGNGESDIPPERRLMMALAMYAPHQYAERAAEFRRQQADAESDEGVSEDDNESIASEELDTEYKYDMEIIAPLEAVAEDFGPLFGVLSRFVTAAP